MTDAVLFLDALTPRELTGVLDDWHQGQMDAGVPRVTPRVMSSIYTGLNPAENGMMAVSKYGGENTTRPKTSTIIDQAVRSDLSVLSMGMPFCIPFRTDSEDSVLSGEAMGGETDVKPEEAQALVLDVPPQADAITNHPDRVYASFSDYTAKFFNQVKENIRQSDPDVAFIGYRLIDTYCHFKHTEEREGQSYRKHLIEDVAAHVERLHQQIDGEVLVFSDHGQTELTDTFRINRWLREKGYLDYTVDREFADKLEASQRGEQHPFQTRVEGQITPQNEPVEVDEENSQLICADPFDSCLTLLCDREDFDEEAFREELMSTGLYRSVDYKWEIYDESAPYYDRMPDVIPDRKEGVFVSGNVHPEPIGMGWYRTGVHDWKAYIGATCDLDLPDGKGREGAILPEQMYDVIRDFIGLEVEAPEIGWDEFTPEEKQLIREKIMEEGE